MKPQSCATALVILAFAAVVFAQGPLDPRTDPEPTMKTLQQIEPRTDLATVAGDPTAMHVIDQPGSYYLSGNLNVITTNGIDIRAGGVTLDLGGFNIARVGGGNATGSAITITGSSLRNITVKNGHITSGVTYDSGAGGDQFTGPGFSTGLRENTAVDPQNVHVSHVHVAGCDFGGIALNNPTVPGTNVVEHCSVNVAGSYGILASEVRHSTAVKCGDVAISAWSVVSCRGESVGSQSDGIRAVGNVVDSYGITTGTGINADGIDAGLSVTNCYGESAGDDGIQAGGKVTNSYGTTTGTGADADGINAGLSVNNCHATSAGDDGIEAGGSIIDSHGITTSTGQAAFGVRSSRNVQGCYGESSGEGGIYAAGTVIGCYGSSTGAGGDAPLNYGILSFRDVAHSQGVSAAGSGILAYGGVFNSYGYTNAATATASGISASLNVNSCYGRSAGGSGISVGGNVTDSVGETTASGEEAYGIRATYNVENSRGESAGSDGISAMNVMNSHGESSSTSSDAHGIEASYNVTNSNGLTTGGDGIHAQRNVMNSHGVSRAEEGTPSGIYSVDGNVSYSTGVSERGDGIKCVRVVSYSTGSGSIGVRAIIAVGCISIGPTAINDKYLMP